MSLPLPSESESPSTNAVAPSIAAGAEDEGEMGAHHHMFFAVELRALQQKLTHFLPLGQEIAFTYDPMLALTPPLLVVASTG